MTDNVREQKRALRVELRERRHTMTEHERVDAAEGFRRNLKALTVARSTQSLACFLSAPFEPATREFLEWAVKHGIRVLLPVSRNDGLLDWTLAHGSEVVGLSGTPEMDSERLGPASLGDVDLIFAPAAAVDLSGARLGWGRGYFDKTLDSMKKLVPVYAVVFDHEVVDAVPREDHDRSVHGVVTPTRVVTF